MLRQSLDQWEIPRSVAGTALFEDVARSGAIGAVERHAHVELELHLILRGQCSFLVEGRRLGAGPGTLVWVPPGVDHLVLGVEGAFQRWMLLFRPRVVRSVLPAAVSRALLRPRSATVLGRRLTLPNARALGRLFDEVRDVAFQTVALHNAGIQFALARAWQLFERSADLPSTSELHPAVARAIVMLRRECPPLRALAKACGASPGHLSRLFAEQVGTSITDFRNRQRIDRFAEIYGDGSRLTMTAAALEAGFGSYAQFYRVLKQVIGATPAEYHRRMAR